MTEKYIYYKDINEDEMTLNFKLQLAKDFYERVRTAIINIEHKAQQIFAASLTTLSIIFGFMTLLLKENININKFAMLVTCIFIFLMTVFIMWAACCALQAFSLKTHCLIGRNDILEKNYKYKELILAKYLNYAQNNEKKSQEKRKHLNTCYKLFKVVLSLFLIYSFLVLFYLNYMLLKPIFHFIITMISKVELWMVILLLSIGINIYQMCKIKKLNKNIADDREFKQIQEEAYYNHLKYPENTQLKNWLMAKEKVLLR